MKNIENIIEYYEDKMNLRKYKICYWINLCLFLPLVILLFYVNLSVINTHFYDTELIYEDLSYNEIEHINSILLDLKVDYFFSSKKIVFTHNVDCGTNCLGKNSLKNIRIEYVDNDYLLRERICHEIIHNFTYNEYLAYDIGENHQEVCFNR